MTNEDRLKILQATLHTTHDTIERAEGYIRDIGRAHEGKPPHHLDQMILSLLKGIAKLREEVAAMQKEIASISDQAS